MTPPKKRKYDSQESDNSDERTTNPPPKRRCDCLYFNDGNIVLIAQDTAFRVHKSVLALHSDVFRNMFEDVNQPEDAEVFDSCSVVRLTDGSSALETFLKALYNIETILHPKVPGVYFPHVLRLATKYLCNALHRQALYAFRCKYYPDTLSAWDTRDSSLAPGYIIRLARDIKAEILLPAVNYHLCLPAFSDRAEVNPSDIFTYFEGKEKLGAFWPEFLQDQVVYCKKPPCKHSHCREGWRIFLEKKTLETLEEIQSPWVDPLSQFNKCSQDIDKVGDVCLETKKIIRKLCDEKRVEIWNELPGIFELGSWEELRAATDGLDG